MPSSPHKKGRQPPEIIEGRAIRRRREDLDCDVIGAGVAVESKLARDHLVLTPGDHGIEEAIASRWLSSGMNRASGSTAGSAS